MNVIPAIDLKDGRCVRLLKGAFDAVTEYDSNPVVAAGRYSSLGCEDLHVVDLDGARSGAQANRDAVLAIIAASEFSVQLGGGIRDAGTLSAWLDAGIARCVVGSVAVSAPDEVSGWLRRFGADRVVLALDVRIGGDATPFLATHGWTAQTRHSLWECLDHYVGAGATQVLCTDISRDGTLSGPNLALYRDIVGRYPGIALQASGGVRNLADLESIRDTGAAAAITGRAILDGLITPAEMNSFLQNA